MKIALVSAFLEDEIYEHKLDDEFMEKVICNEDHFYHRIAKALEQKGLEPVVHYLSQEKVLKKFTHKYGHEIIRIPAKKYPFIHESIVYSPELIKNIKNNFDICNFVSGYYVKYKIPDMFDYTVSKLHKKMPVIARWAGGNHKWLLPIRKEIKKTSLKRCDKIICSGQEEIKNLEKTFQISNEKILQIMNPIDTTVFKFREKQIAANKLELDVNYEYLLYVGRFSKNKGIEQILQIFKKLNNNNSNLKIILIGNGPLLDEIKKFIKQNHLENYVILPGRLTHEITCYYYNISSVLLNIGASGGLANVIIEAIASKLPIIAINVGASKDYVGGKFNNGILINSTNELELEKAIIEIIENKKKYINSNENILKKFTFEFFGQTLKQSYMELLNK
jgi:glycosyltransferase involved in cell wall biosynthesis